MEEFNSKESNGNIWQLKALNEELNNLTLVVEDELTVGRGKDNNVVLGSKSISRNHAHLKVVDNALQVVDLGSSNGTFINDKQIQPNEAQILNIEDVVSFATFKFKVSKQEQSPQNDSTSVVDGASSDVEKGYPRSTEEVDTSNKETLNDQLEQELEEPIPVGDPDQEVIKPINKEALSQSSNSPKESKKVQNEKHFQKLAEESDPEVLKSKQAATTKLEGTVNIDDKSSDKKSTQKVDKSFNTLSEQKHHDVAHVNRERSDTNKVPEQKSNSIWWILLILLALAVALWLFNTGQIG